MRAGSPLANHIMRLAAMHYLPNYSQCKEQNNFISNITGVKIVRFDSTLALEYARKTGK